MDIGSLIRARRVDLGLTQAQLAALLALESGNPDGKPTRDEVKRWESGKVTPGPYWRGGLAAVLDLTRAELDAAARTATAQRRTFLAATGVAIAGPRRAELLDMLSAVAGGDERWLSHNISPYDLGMTLANLTNRDQGTRRRLSRWLDNGSTSLLRGNVRQPCSRRRMLPWWSGRSCPCDMTRRPEPGVYDASPAVRSGWHGRKREPTQPSKHQQIKSRRWARYSVTQRMPRIAGALPCTWGKLSKAALGPHGLCWRRLCGRRAAGRTSGLSGWH